MLLETVLKTADGNEFRCISGQISRRQVRTGVKVLTMVEDGLLHTHVEPLRVDQY